MVDSYEVPQWFWQWDPVFRLVLGPHCCNCTMYISSSQACGLRLARGHHMTEWFSILAAVDGRHIY